MTLLPLGEPVRFLIVRWEEGWEFGCPVVVLEPVLRYYDGGQSIEAILEDVCLDLAIDRERNIPLSTQLGKGDQKEFEWRGWNLPTLRRKAEQLLQGEKVRMSRAVRDGFAQARQYWVKFERALSGEVNFYQVARPQ